jgi:hypothetical protein
VHLYRWKSQDLAVGIILARERDLVHIHAVHSCYSCKYPGTIHRHSHNPTKLYLKHPYLWNSKPKKAASSSLGRRTLILAYGKGIPYTTNGYPPEPEIVVPNRKFHSDSNLQHKDFPNNSPCMLHTAHRLEIPCKKYMKTVGDLCACALFTMYL